MEIKFRDVWRSSGPNFGQGVCNLSGCVLKQGKCVILNCFALCLTCSR